MRINFNENRGFIGTFTAALDVSREHYKNIALLIIKYCVPFIIFFTFVETFLFSNLYLAASYNFFELPFFQSLLIKLVFYCINSSIVISFIGSYLFLYQKRIVDEQLLKSCFNLALKSYFRVLITNLILVFFALFALFLLVVPFFLVFQNAFNATYIAIEEKFNGNKFKPFAYIKQSMSISFKVFWKTFIIFYFSIGIIILMSFYLLIIYSILNNAALLNGMGFMQTESFGLIISGLTQFLFYIFMFFPIIVMIIHYYGALEHKYGKNLITKIKNIGL